MPADPSWLSDIPFFSLMDAQERASLAALACSDRFAAGTPIFHHGDVGESLFVIRQGRVEFYVENRAGERIVLSQSGPGELFGELSLLAGGARSATAVACEDCELIRIDHDNLIELVTRHPRAALSLLTVVGQRLQSNCEMLRSEPIRNVNVEEQEHLTFADRLADRVAAFGGSWSFIISFGVFLVTWIVINTLLIANNGGAFDPYPYILLNLLLGTVAALQAPVIMMSQNRQGYKDRLKADIEYEVNLKAAREVGHLHQKIDELYERMEAHFSQLKKKPVSEEAARVTV
jgi:uncharacterized membrane protein